MIILIIVLDLLLSSDFGQFLEVVSIEIYFDQLLLHFYFELPVCDLNLVQICFLVIDSSLQLDLLFLQTLYAVVELRDKQFQVTDLR